MHGRSAGPSLQFDASVADVVEQVGGERHELRARAEEQRVLDHVGVEAFLLVLDFLQFICTWNLYITTYIFIHYLVT